MGSYVVCSRNADDPWHIESWTNDSPEADRRAKQLVTPPDADSAACVGVIDGTGDQPTITWRNPVEGTHAKT